MRDDEIGIPPSIEAAWGLGDRRRKGPKPGLTLQRIVTAAVAVAGREGLGAVSMSRVATELGSSPMSLYRYVGAKDELVALMVDAALGLPPGAEDAEESWRDGLSRWAWAQLAAYRRHPWALQVPISGPPLTPNSVAWMESALWTLRATALPEHDKASVLLLVSGYVRNEASLAASVDAGLASAHGSPDAGMRAWSDMLRRLTDAERFPALTAVLHSGALDRADPPDEEFTFGLGRVLDGIEMLVADPSRGARDRG